MKKALKGIGICLLIGSILWCGTIFADKRMLQKELIRLHVVGASDSETDQALKLCVRDAVVELLQAEMCHLTSAEQAKVYLQERISKVEAVANRTLRASGCAHTVTVTLQPEEFTTRYYDTFTLPAGIYESLRITIGEGAGKNWWCVVFPSLCVGATVEEFSETALCAGMPEGLAGALAGEEEYEVRFFLLDALGKFENFLHKG